MSSVAIWDPRALPCPGCISVDMVGREEKAKRYVRWAFYLDGRGSKVSKWKRCLRDVAEGGRVLLQIHEVSENRMDLEWPHPVTWNSAWRITNLATQLEPSFRILGDPRGIVEAATAIESAPLEASAPASHKRRRMSCKGADAATPTTMLMNPAPLTPRAVSAPDAAAAASSSGIAPVQRVPTPESAEALAQLPTCLLPMKWEEMQYELTRKNNVVRDSKAYEVNWAEPLGEGAYGVVYAGRAHATQQEVAVKVLKWELRRDFALELTRCVAAAGHPDIVKIVDVASFRQRPLVSEELNQPVVALVLERFETSVRQFLKKATLELAGKRHVLQKVASALKYMHSLGIMHADLKPANILMRPEAFARERWALWSIAGSAEDQQERDLVFRGCISGRGCIFQVVLSDLGNAELASAALRTRPKLSHGVIQVCTEEYRAPDLFLGNTRFDQALDMWSLGCVAVELVGRRPLFSVGRSLTCASDYLKMHLRCLGSPSISDWKFLLRNMKAMMCDLDVLRRAGDGLPPHASLRDTLRPRHMADFVCATFKWNPEDRITAASACSHPFLKTPDLSVAVSFVHGKHGRASICAGFLEEEVLDYLQHCPALAAMSAECRAGNFEANGCISDAEAQRRMKREFVGYVTGAEHPPRCRSLNNDANLEPLRSDRIAAFGRALRAGASGWLHQLQERMRAEIRRVGLPVDYLPNAGPFIDEDLRDNALVYASVQVMKVGVREDGWHTDGGASLLHAGVTIYGSRRLQVRLGHDGSCISLPQQPGSFYVGNVCAIEHNVEHVEAAPGTWGAAPPESQLQVAVMLRSDLFRQNRARRINACPGPRELFRVVNDVFARHLAEVPFPMPNMTAVMAAFESGGA